MKKTNRIRISNGAENLEARELLSACAIQQAPIANVPVSAGSNGAVNTLVTTNSTGTGSGVTAMDPNAVGAGTNSVTAVDPNAGGAGTNSATAVDPNAGGAGTSSVTAVDPNAVAYSNAVAGNGAPQSNVTINNFNGRFGYGHGYNGNGYGHGHGYYGHGYKGHGYASGGYGRGFGFNHGFGGTKGSTGLLC